MIKYFIFSLSESAYLSVDNDWGVVLDRTRRFDTYEEAQSVIDNDPVCPNGYYEIRKAILKS